MDQDERRYFALKELARISGVSEVTLRRYWRDGKITGFQPGGRGSRVLFPHDALERNSVAPPAALEPPPNALDGDQGQHPFDASNKLSAGRPPRAHWRKRLHHTQTKSEET